MLVSAYLVVGLTLGFLVHPLVLLVWFTVPAFIR
jgi:hypothetical protein